MNAIGSGFLLLFFLVVMAVVLPALLIWFAVRIVGLMFRIFGLGSRTVGRGGGALVRFISGMLNDALSLVTGLFAAAIALLLGLTNILLLRGKAIRHYFTSLEDELIAVLQCAYRLIIGHPLRLLGMGPALKNMEERMPPMMAGPATARPRGQASAPPTRSGSQGAEDEFPGYSVLGQLPPGGSGALLHVANPTESKVKEMLARGISIPQRVVIKAFSLDSGSTLPQIVRESRALEAAGRLGLVIEHNLDDTRFHYVMPFIEGVTLDVTATQLHEQAGTRGLKGSSLQAAISHARDLTRILARFHAEGLWHKDIKPSNLIVGPDGLHVVDLGLVTPLASAMTLTTHGTEYYRDPELVRLAMKGVKVHQVDGAKFDIYGTGAVLYTLLEDAFPAHGSLSRFDKPSPKALQFVVRKAMAEMDSRYEAADHMTQDLEFLLAAKDVWAVQPAQLPSFNGTLPSIVKISHTGPNRALAGHHAEAASGWEEPPSTHGDRGPVTRAAAAAGWTAPPVRHTDALDRTGRRRKRRGPFKALALAGIGACSLVFYLAAFTTAFHKYAYEVLPRADAPSISQDEGGSLDGPLQGPLRFPLQGPVKALSVLPPQSPVLVAGGSTPLADVMRAHLLLNDFIPVILDAARSKASRRELLAGIQVQIGSGGLAEPETQQRVREWQQKAAPEITALIWLDDDPDTLPEVLMFGATSSSN